jgi:hypothetical protein
MAYDRLDSIEPSFYKIISNNFDMLTVLINLVSKKSKMINEMNSYFLIDANKKEDSN